MRVRATIVAEKKQLSISCSQYVFIALLLQHALYYIVICGLSGCTLFFHIIP